MSVKIYWQEWFEVPKKFWGFIILSNAEDLLIPWNLDFSVMFSKLFDYPNIFGQYSQNVSKKKKTLPTSEITASI